MPEYMDAFKYKKSIKKAINVRETPLDETHVKRTIKGTQQKKGAHEFWRIVQKRPFKDFFILTWNFCHVLHIVLRKGGDEVVNESQRHRKFIEDLGKPWQNSKVCYGKLIGLYTNFLLRKLEFHRLYPKFPGNLCIKDKELESICNNNIENYSEMVVQMFHYLDGILNLQKAIFESLDRSRNYSMWSSGQCKLAPLIPCIQDSIRLYEYSVKILFLLHGSMPAVTLEKQRETFNEKFELLRNFYNDANTSQYLKNFIKIPYLDKPPNFLGYVIPEEKPET